MNVEDVLNAVFQNSFEGLLFVDEQSGTILNSNEIAQELLGFTKEELHHAHIDQVLPYNLSELKQLSQQTPKASKQIRRTLIAQRKDKSGFLLNIKVSTYKQGTQLFYIIHFENTGTFQISEINQSLYSSIINSSHDGIISKNLDGKILTFNKGAEKILGYEADEIIGKHISKIIPIHLIGEEKDILTKITSGQRIEHYETERIKKDGSIIHVALTVSPIKDANNNIIGASKILRDITEIKGNAQKQKTIENYYQSILNQAADSIYITDADDNPKFIEANQSFCQLLQYEKHEILKMSVADFVFSEDFKHTPSSLEALRKGKTVRVERRLKRKDGSAVEVEVSAVKLMDGNLLGVARDISDKKKNEKELIAREKKFRTLVENNYDLISLLDDNLRVIYRSPSVYRVMGYDHHQEMAIEAMERAHPDELEYSKQLILKAQANPGHPIPAIIRRQHKQGHYLWLEGVITNLLHDEDIKAYVTNFRDITERIKTQETLAELNKSLEQKVIERTKELQQTIVELKESEEKFLKVFHTEAAGISLNRCVDSVFTDVNETYCNIIGYSKKEIIGRNSLQLNLITDFERRNQLLEDLKIKGSAKNYEMKLLTHQGNTITILANTEIILYKGERYYLNIIYDITDIKNIQEQLITVNKELEAFSYSVSHDLRAPLRAVSGYAQILDEDYGLKLDATAKDIIKKINTNASKMGLLIDDLLSFSKLGRKDLVKEPINLHLLLVEAMNEIDKTMVYQNKLNIGQLPVVYADYSLLKQVFINLISNAIKYSQHHATKPIEIEARERTRDYVFSIKDHGAGFDMRYVDKLFAVFSRLHSQEEFDGTGVGLAIVKRIVSKHGGEVWAEGEVNKGATFYFTIPKINDDEKQN